MPYADTAAVMGDAFRLVFTVEEEFQPSDWSDRYRILVGGDMPGQWSTARVPYMKAVMNACADPEVRVVTLSKPAQCAGTESIFSVVLWSMDQRPGSWMVMLPKAEKAETFHVKRFQPALLKCDRAMRHVGANPRNLKSARTDFDRGTIEWIGSNSESSTEGTPARFVWIDEYDRCDELARSKLLERGKTFADTKVIETGTPGYAGQGIDARRTAASWQGTWYVPCPHCRKYHTRTWRQVRWRDGSNADPTVVRRTAWFECPHCAKACVASDRAWQGRLGVWAAQGQAVGDVGVDAEGLDIAGEVVGERPPVDHMSFAFLGIDNDLIANPYGEVAAAFLEKIRAHGQIDFVWCTETLGEPYAVKGSRVELSELQARARNSDTIRGRCPAGTGAVIVMCDVQVDRAYWTAFAFSNRGRDIWLVDWGCEICLGDGTLAEVLDGMHKRSWFSMFPSPPTPDNPRPQYRSFAPVMVGVDTGHRTEVIYRYRIARSASTVLVKGFARKGTLDNRPYTRSVLEHAGSKFPLFRVNVTVWKNSMARWLSGVAPDQLDMVATLVDGSDSGMTSTWHLPKDSDDGLLSQLCSEHFSGGLWVERKKDAPNHYWDCFVYAAAILEAFGVREFTKGPSHGKEQPVNPPPSTVGDPAREPIAKRFL